MSFLVLACATIFSILATAIMSYISMSTPIGPWIETILALSGMLLLALIGRFKKVPQDALGLMTAAGGIAGIVATACAFSFPTFFFLDKELFLSYLHAPLAFLGLMAGLCIAAGLFGYAIASGYAEHLLKEPDMPFPIGELTAKMLTAQHSMKMAIELGIGFISTILYHLSQLFIRWIPAKILLIPAIKLSFFKMSGLLIRLDTAPMLFAIGFVTGHVLALPLLMGVLTKWFILDPAQALFFSELSYENVILAFCSGLMLQSALMSIIDVPKILITAYKRLTRRTNEGTALLIKLKNSIASIEISIGLLIICSFLWFCNFSFLEQIYLLIFTFICTYQLMIIGGKIGLAPLGRFATIVMLPALILFGYHPLKATLIATFVEISGGVAVDVLFGRKMAEIAYIDRQKIAWFQLLGLVVSAMAIGGIFWFLINHFGLGSTELFVQRAQARALLINAFHFDYILIAIGTLYGFFLKYLSINPLLVLGGLSMPVDFSLLLIAGGLSTYVSKDKERWYPLWSGVFAASSLWMVLRALSI